MNTTTKHPPTNTPARNSDLKRIHSTARNLGMSEFARRALQFEVTGKESALLMTATERAATINALETEAATRRPVPTIDHTDEAALQDLLGW